MKIILNHQAGSTNFKQALGELVDGAETLSLAVSYLQVGGWELFRRHTSGLSLPKMRIVCTDQLGITPPAAGMPATEPGKVRQAGLRRLRSLLKDGERRKRSNARADGIVSRVGRDRPIPPGTILVVEQPQASGAKGDPGVVDADLDRAGVERRCG